MTAPEPISGDLSGLGTPSTAAERALLLDRLWAALPSHLTAALPPHTIDFTPARDGHGLEATAHQWGPLRVSLYLSRGGTISIEDGTNTLTGQPLTVKTLLDIADVVQDALSGDPDYGTLIQAMQAVGYQTFDRPAQDDAERVTRALADLVGPVAFRADPHNETDHGDGWALVDRRDFDPTQVYPGAVVHADLGGVVVAVSILSTALHERADGQPAVLVTHRPWTGGSASPVWPLK
ncbi:hypothetical protein ABEG17_08345 [Pedococcus sp. KACC 23699]|uniref:Uncharacterized protein n=1 Tax=Pedococcus sp. KACC 23699 TaxID=3149228 RepID=A0AAU7JYL1_9MICO